MATPVTPDAYRPHLQQEFVLHHEGSVHAFTLAAIETTVDDAAQLSFSLFFQGPASRLPQGTYRLSHPALGELDLFLVPILQRQTGLCLQAVFNLLKGETQ